MFAFLAGEEAKHKELFEDILKNLDNSFALDSYTGEYQVYLNALARECTFAQDAL